MVGRPLTHVVRDAFCEGDEGIAEVREQHGYPPTASAVRECSGNVVGVHAVSLEIMQNVTSTIRTIYLPWVQCKRGHCIGECCILASLYCGVATSGTCSPQLKAVWGAVCPMQRCCIGHNKSMRWWEVSVVVELWSCGCRSGCSRGCSGGCSGG